MKSKFIFIFFSILLTTACNSLNIFDSSNGSEEKTTHADSTLLLVKITGGIAGINQRFVLTADGGAVFEDGWGQGTRWTKQLSAEHVQDLKSTMASNNFFGLDSHYVDPQLRDGFIYEINYQEGGASHQVVTDNYGAPARVDNIVRKILGLIELTKSTNLELSLQLSKQEMHAGESVDLTLTVTNAGDSPVTLHFNDGQVFDFQAFAAARASFEDGQASWTWSHSMFFTQALWQFNLEPGQNKSYTVTWDGKDDSGNSMVGVIVITANLVSRPGGSPVQQTMTILE